jgi:hypothetical protein
MEFEYKSVFKEHIPGQSYTPADDILSEEGMDGWELISVVAVNGVYENAIYEIFYLKRKVPGGPSAVPR